MLIRVPFRSTRVGFPSTPATNEFGRPKGVVLIPLVTSSELVGSRSDLSNSDSDTYPRARSQILIAPRKPESELIPLYNISSVIESA